MSAAAAPEEELLNCKRCGWTPLSEFTLNPNGEPYVHCEPCKPIVAAQKKAWGKTDIGKATIKRNKKTDKAKATQKRNRATDNGKARKRRSQAKKRERRATDPKWRLMMNTHNIASNVLSGHTENSPTFLTRTGWESTAFRSHVLASVPPGSGFTMANYGRKDGVWEIDLRIPQEAYNFDDPNDILRCWNPRNVRGISEWENKRKGMTLLDDQVAYVGADCFPASWHGEVPSEEERQAFYQRVKTRQEVQAEQEEDEDEESESD